MKAKTKKMGKYVIRDTFPRKFNLDDFVVSISETAD